MIIVGLTGSIGMGKTTVAGQFASLGARICDADAIVHSLLAKGGAAVEPVSRAFPGTAQDGAIDRRALGAIVFHEGEKMKTLEAIVHPLVVAAENNFLDSARREGVNIAVLEIPLLYETGAESRCDAVVVATAPPGVQKCRVLKRPGMNAARFRHILAMQMPDREKRRRADFVVQTGFGRAYSLFQVKRIMRKLSCAK